MGYSALIVAFILGGVFGVIITSLLHANGDD